MRQAILTFDLAQHTGYAWCAADALYTGTIDVSKCSGDNRHGIMFTQWVEEITHLIRTVAPAAVYYEDAGYAQRSNAARKCYFFFEGALQAICHQLGVDVHPVSTSTYKARAGVKYRCGKKAIIEWCNVRNIPVTSEDEADAVAILNAVLPDHGCKLEQFTWRKP